jgi:hypothetical protein
MVRPRPKNPHNHQTHLTADELARWEAYVEEVARTVPAMSVTSTWSPARDGARRDEPSAHRFPASPGLRSTSGQVETPFMISPFAAYVFGAVV